MKPIIPFVEYVVDYDYISEVLCINKDKPEMHCDGKCYLMQTLAKAAKEKKDEKLPVKVEFQLLFCEDCKSEVVQNHPLAQVKRKSQYQEEIYQFNGLTSLLRPPIS